jgi:hypothetical protein
VVCRVCNSQHIKGFAVGGDEPTVLQNRVRNDEIEQAPLFTHFLPLVERCSSLREFEKPYTLIHVRLIRPLMLFDFAQDVRLFGTPRTAFLIKKCLGDGAVELIDIHGVQAMLKLLILLLERGDHLVMVALGVAVAGLECSDHPGQHGAIEADRLERQAKLRRNVLLADIFFRAFAFVPRTVIVDVTALLDFCSDGTATMPTGEQALESPPMLLLMGPMLAFFRQDLLHAGE